MKKKGFFYMLAVALVALMGFTVVGPTLEAQAGQQAPTATQSINTVSRYSGLRTGDLPSFIATIIRWILGLVGVVLIAMFVYGGVMYATSAGNDERVETGKNIMIYAVIGTAIIVVAFIASEYIINALLSDPQTGRSL